MHTIATGVVDEVEGVEAPAGAADVVADMLRTGLVADGRDVLYIAFL